MPDAPMILLRLIPAPPIRFRFGLSAAIVPAAPSAPQPIAVVIGPKGDEGDPGPPGPAGQNGDGAADPGDLTLIFNNQLI
jgi:hypothetical protein